MKKIVIIALFLIGACTIYVYINSRNTSLPTAIKPLIKAESNKIVRRSSIFIPYWALGKGKYSLSSHDSYYYFGIAVDQNGINKSDPGYTGLGQFNCPKTKKCYLVIRMLNNEVNTGILKDTKAQEEIINQTLDIADTYNFSGVALDLELSGLFDATVTGQINSFVQRYYTLAKKNYKTLSFIIYGDNYFRRRPYDISFIGKHTDEVMIMAYDFHRSYGEPGPNFPFDRRSPSESGGEGGSGDYGYDFKQMISDFSSEVPSDKLTVIFGMYGYDWTLNEQGLPLKKGEAITNDQITNNKFQITNKSQIPNSKEKKIEYIDKENQKHVIWYEDEESAEVKRLYLMGEGIGSVSYWAYGYF